MTGRIGSYTHSDSITENKGCAVVKVTTQTDFAARTDEFKSFVTKAAKMAYAANQIDWAEVIAVFPDIETERLALEKTMREKIVVAEISILRL